MIFSCVCFLFKNSIINLATEPIHFQVGTNTTLKCSINNFSSNDFLIYKIGFYFNFSDENVTNYFALYEVNLGNFCFYVVFKVL